MRLWLKILVVIVGLWLGLVALDKLYTFGLQHNQNIKIANVQLLPKNTELLIHGPCEPLWMLSPALLDPVTGLGSYNLALSHSDFADNYLHLYFYLKANQAPNYLLLYVTPESFDKRFNTFNSYRFAPYLHDSLVSAVVKENDPGYYQWCALPFMRYAYYNGKINFEVLQGYKHYFTGRSEAYYPDGFEPPTNRVWSNHNAEFAELYKENTIFKWDSLREKYLIKIIRLAKSYGVKVYLYESPVLHDALAFQPNRPAMIQKIKNMAVSEKVPFVQFDQLPLANERKYYISTLNFNMAGVKIFNDTLGRYIKRVMLCDTLVNP